MPSNSPVIPVEMGTCRDLSYGNRSVALPNSDPVREMRTFCNRLTYCVMESPSAAADPSIGTSSVGAPDRVGSIGERPASNRLTRGFAGTSTATLRIRTSSADNPAFVGTLEKQTFSTADSGPVGAFKIRSFRDRLLLLDSDLGFVGVPSVTALETWRVRGRCVLMYSQKIQSYFLERRLEFLILADMGSCGLAQERAIHFGASTFLSFGTSADQSCRSKA
jgi:hypothetical protein